MALYTNIKGPVNYTIVGSPTIVDGVVSGFSSSNYLKLNSNIDFSKTLEYKFRFTTGSVVNTEQVIFWRGDSTYGLGYTTHPNGNYSYLYYRNSSSNTYKTANFKIQPNTTYDILIKSSNGTIKWWLGEPNNLIEQTSINFDFTNISGVGPNIGYGINTNCYFTGIIDLNNSYINVDGNAWFGTSFSRVKLHSPTAIAYTKVGNPTITSDGIASGFTDKTDYLTLGAFNPGTSKWKFTTKVKIYDYATQISLIDRNSSTRCFQIVVRTTGKFRVNISTNGTSKANEVDGTHVVSVNTIYYISFEYDGSKYYLKYSLDNINWVTDITINNSTKIYPVSTMCMGHSWYNSGTEKWNGEIYLRYTRFEIDGVTNDKYKLHALEGDYAIVDDRLVWANPNIYLQSSSISAGQSKYIDTEYYPNNNTRVVLIIKNLQRNYGIRLFGEQYSPNYFRFGTSIGTRWMYGYGSQGNKYSTINFTHDKIKVDFDKNVLKINDTIIETFAEETFVSNKTAYLFNINISSLTDAWDAPVYACFIYDNGTLVRHFVPVPTGMVIGDFTVPSNGMFDIVNQQFYPNQGTGTFTYGKDE